MPKCSLSDGGLFDIFVRAGTITRIHSRGRRLKVIAGNRTRLPKQDGLLSQPAALSFRPHFPLGYQTCTEAVIPAFAEMTNLRVSERVDYKGSLPFLYHIYAHSNGLRPHPYGQTAKL